MTHALAWIVGSMLLVGGISYPLMKGYLRGSHRNLTDPKQALSSIIQTGPQSGALTTEYLAELLGISRDRPVHAKTFSLARAKERLLSSALISQAEVKLIPPGTLYIDYTVRQPVVFLEDYENVALDKAAYPFAFSPFFSPKNLPSIYLGLAPFGTPTVEPERGVAQWGSALQGKYIALAFDVLAIVTDPQVADLFSVQRIDVSNAFSESYGTREIVVITHDVIYRQINGKEVQLHLPRILRLSTSNYAQELSRYLTLRAQLLKEEEKKGFALLEGAGPVMRCEEKIIDFRIQKLAFIQEATSI